MNRKVDIAVALLKQDLSGDTSLTKLAQSVNLSVSHLRSMFKAETGLSFRQYLKSLRMREAKLLLKTTLLSVKEIRISVGISDDSHFTRDFKQAYGVTPTRYRALHLNASAVMNNRRKAK
jgi:two-component system response regulator YesN